MPTVEFLPSRKSVSVPKGTELLDAAHQAGVLIESSCGGKGTCGSCIVRVASGYLDAQPGTLTQTVMAEGYVLACRSRVLDEPVTIEVPEQIGYEGGKLVETDETYLVRRELLPKSFQFDPLGLKWLLEVPPARREDGLSDLDRLTRAIRREWGRLNVVYPLSVMRSAAEALRADGGRVTVTLIREQRRRTRRGKPAQLRVVRLEPGDTTTRHFGLAIDVGTTTVAVQLINLTIGRIMTTRSDYNDQIACGADVLSRINYARRPQRREELRTRALNTINRLIGTVAASHDVDPREICNAVISGNTTMTHLLLGLTPEYIRLDPYTPTVLQPPFLPAADIGIEINPDSWVYLSPCVASYVGGDITAGLLCTDLATDTDEVSLFIDIGTNGELVLGNREFLMACACSAGPAFEGGGIDCGMRAALGAIETVEVDPDTGAARYSTVGHVRPRGICGSGMIDLLAKLFVTGWIDPAGKLDRTRPSPSIVLNGRKAAYVVAPAEETATGAAITISETDIENIIRAKAAIYSACSLMLRRLEMDFDDLANIYIGGGFGRFLDLENATLLGLLPDIPPEKFHYVGNTSLMGSYMLAVSQDYRQRQLDLARRMTCIELSTEPSYMEQYTGAMFLPHTDRARFPSVWERVRRLRAGGARRGGAEGTKGEGTEGTKRGGAGGATSRLQSPGTAVPQSPGIAVPQSPGTAVPQSPGIAVPQSPGTAVPQSPGTAVPGLPLRTGTGAPGSSVETDTVVPGITAEPGTTAPGLPGETETSVEPTNKQKAEAEAAALAAARLADVDLADRCRLLGLAPPQPDGSVVVRVLGHDLRLKPPTFEATVVASGDAARPPDRILALHYLLCDLPADPTGELISFRHLPSGSFYWESFLARSVKPLQERIGNDLEQLRRNLDRFQWTPVEIGDLGARIQAVGRIDVTLVYRAGDEEFDPSAEVFFDAAIRRVFNAEDVAVLAGRICLGLL